MITLSKTGKIYTYTHTQENYKADSYFQVLAHIIGSDPDFKNTDDCTWRIDNTFDSPWRKSLCWYTPSLTAKACPRKIIIITEVTK